MRARLPGFVLAFAIAALVALPLAAADRPPQDLHLVGDHWTAWNPPAPPPGPRSTSSSAATPSGTSPPGSTATPTSGRRSGSATSTSWTPTGSTRATRWCSGIEVAPVDRTSTELGEPASSRRPRPRRPPTPTASSRPARRPRAPVPLGAESDIYCSGYIGELDEDFPYSDRRLRVRRRSTPTSGRPARARRVAGIFGPIGTVKYDLSTGDIVYLDGGRAGGLRPGEVFTVVLPARSRSSTR